MRTGKTKTTSILTVLLIYVFIAGNTSGELALCIGDNWHIAIEPLNHEHNENHPHIEHNSSSTEHQHDGHLESPHCKPCIDIPIFIGTTDNRLPLKQVKSNSNTLVSLVGCALHTTGTDKWCALHTLSADACRYPPYIDENRFLRSVILLV